MTRGKPDAVFENGVEGYVGQQGDILLRTRAGTEFHFMPATAVALALWIIRNVGEDFYDVKEDGHR